MYVSHIELERRERNRELMSNAARERLVNEAVAGRKAGDGGGSRQVRSRAWLIANAAAAASILIAYLGHSAWPKSH